MRDVSQILTSRLVLVAAAAAAVDVVGFILLTNFEGISANFQGRLVEVPLFTALIGAADLALVASARFSGVVWIAQALTRLAAAWIFAPFPPPAEVLVTGFPVGGYMVGAWLSMKRGLQTMLVVLVIGGAELFVEELWKLTSFVGLLFWVVSRECVPFLVGRYTVARRAHIASLEQQLRQQGAAERAELEKERAEERSAIARDLHDVISHHVSATSIHAGAARLALVSSDTAAAVRSLAAVESSSRSAMADLGRQLDLLHGRDLDGRSQPGLANIDQLLENVREAGMRVFVQIRGAVPELAESLDLALYRIVQEVLTNALKHGTGTARLEIDYSPSTVVIRQTNLLPQLSSSQPGSTSRGLCGVRERAALFHGNVQFGADESSLTWCFEASFPVEQQ